MCPCELISAHYSNNKGNMKAQTSETSQYQSK